MPFMELFFIICFASYPYFSSLQGDLVFDDSEAIEKITDVHESSWVEFFSNHFWEPNIRSYLNHKSYGPLTLLSFKLNYLLGGEKLIPLHFKITNIVCHIIGSLLVWQAFCKLLKENRTERLWRDEPFLSAILFSVHPTHVEAVSGIVGRADILAGITFFLAFLVYDKGVTTSNRISFLYMITVIFISGVSMLFKENGVTVMGFCIIYEVLTKLKMKTVDQRKKLSLSLGSDSIFRLSLITLTALCLLYGRWSIMGGVQPEPVDNPAAFANSTFTRVATFNYIYFLNILLLLWPQWLCYDWSMGCIPLIDNINDFRIVAVILMYLYGLFILLALLSNRNREETKRAIALAVSLTVLPFLPAANIFYPVGFVIAERVLYISSAGYCLLIVIGLSKIAQMKSFRKIGISLYILLLVTFALRSCQRSWEWRTEYQLLTSGLSVCPLNAKVHYNVAKVAEENKDTAWALEEYKTAIRLYPEYYQAMNNLADLLKNLKKHDDAEYYLRKALSIKKDFPAAWMNLGIVLANTRRFKESHNAYNMALKYRKEFPDCYYYLGFMYWEMKHTEAALDSWLEAIKINPKHYPAWTTLLEVLENIEQFEKALQFIPRALKELPDSPSVNFATANIYSRLDRLEDAEHHYIRAIKLYDEDIQAIHYSKLGMLYHRWNKYAEAKEMYKKSLEIDPEDISTKINLQNVIKLLEYKLFR